jgi:hypothetical protein
MVRLLDLIALVIYYKQTLIINWKAKKLPEAFASIDLVFETKACTQTLDFEVNELVVAGWTGRDRDGVEHHIRELEALGIARPKSTPIYYRASASRLTTRETIEMIGTDSSGEVEFVLLQAEGNLWVGVGSDHTDRKVEAYGVTVSKQMCDKPIAGRVWSMSDISDHWDALQTRSWISWDGQETLYQEGPVTQMLSPKDLIEGYFGVGGMRDGSVMFCGTHAAIGGIRPSRQFRFELFDPVLNRTIEHSYSVTNLANEG